MSQVPLQSIITLTLNNTLPVLVTCAFVTWQIQPWFILVELPLAHYHCTSR